MADLPNIIASEVAGLQDGELQNIARQLEESRRENESLIKENAALKLVNEELKKKLQSTEDRLRDIESPDLVWLLDSTL